MPSVWVAQQAGAHVTIRAASIKLTLSSAGVSKVVAGLVRGFESKRMENEKLRHLTPTLRALETYDELIEPSFVDALGLSLTSRLLSLYHGQAAVRFRRSSPLVKWRLSRVTEFIEEHIDHTIYLSEFSSIAGLSRMHCAGQIRAATGYPPAAYIMRRRISRAQKFLAQPDLSISDIALRVGFSSQAHFTASFRKIVGDTPARWRRTR